MSGILERIEQKLDQLLAKGGATAAAAPAPAPTPAPGGKTQEHVRQGLKVFMEKTGNRDATVAFLTKYGVNSVSELPADKCAPILVDIKAALDAHEAAKAAGPVDPFA